MKKLLVLLVVLSVASAASAGILDIKITGVDGTPLGAPASEATVAPSSNVQLAITWDSTAGQFLFALGDVIKVTGPGTLSLASTARSADWDSTLEVKGTRAGLGQYIVEAAALNGPAATPGTPILVVTNILLHVDAAQGDITVSLIDDIPSDGSLEHPGDFTTFTKPNIGAGVVIHTPEPMTMMLLGLGSLFLVKRKK